MSNLSLTTPDCHTFGSDGSATAAGGAPAGDLIVTAQGGMWLRRLGPLAWAVLGVLALAAHDTEQGWVAPVGVREVAARVGVTKDTAARAVAALGATGLIVLQRVQALDGRWRSGYRLQLPDGLELRARPNHPDPALPKVDDACPDWQDTRCPATKDSRDHCPNEKDRHPPIWDNSDGCPARPDSPASTEATPGHPSKRRRQLTDTPTQAAVQHRRLAAAIQPTLFGPIPSDDPRHAPDTGSHADLELAAIRQRRPQ
jgi:hypothetical protein